MAKLLVQLLGGFAISLDGAVLLPGRRNTRLALFLAYMLLRRGKRQSREHLAFIFWADSNEGQARTNLRGLLSSLRRQAPELAAYLEDDDPYLCWRVDSEQHIDVFAFEEMLQHAQALGEQDRSAALDLLKQAVASYTGELLPGCYADWVLADRYRLHSIYLDALMWLVEWLESSGQMRDAIRWAETLLQADRMREQSHFLLMRLLAAVGDRARALAVYAECARLLGEELGVEPSQEIEELHRRLLLEPIAGVLKSLPRPPSVSLVGREMEWQHLLDGWQMAAAGNAQVVVLTGEAGIGKTRFARQFADEREREGAVVLAASCPQAKDPVAYVALANWLSSPNLIHRLRSLSEEDLTYLQLLSPALRRRYPNLRPPAPLTPHWQRLHLHQALATLLTNPDEPVLLVLDDAQWCDEESLEWLHYFFSTQRDARMLVLLAVRTGESQERPLTLVRTEMLAKGWLRQIELTRLSFQETVQLVTQVASIPFDAQTIERLYAVSAGIPLFVIELTRMLAPLPLNGSSARLTRLDANAALPATVSALILHRLASLTAAARQLLDAAAVIGNRFSDALLSRVDRLSDDARVEALDELWHRALIVKADVSLYDFDHELVREVVYHQLSDVRRRYLHKQTADALADVYADDLIDHAAQIAEHHTLAENLTDAAHFHLLATTRGPGALSIDAASGHLERAIDLLARTPRSARATELMFACWLQLGTLLLRHKGYDDPGAQRAFQQAHGVSRQLIDPLLRFLALRGLWEVKWGTGQLTSALEAATELLEIADSLHSAEAQAEAFWALGATLFYLGEYARAEETLRMVAAASLGAAKFPHICHPTIAAQCYLAFIEAICGDPDQGVGAMQAIVEAAEQHADAYTFLFALMHLAILQYIVRDADAVFFTSQRLAELSARYDFAGFALVASRLRSWASVMRTSPAMDASVGGAMDEVDVLYQMVMDRTGVVAEVGALLFIVALAEALIRHRRDTDALMVIETGLRLVHRQGAAIAEIDLHRLHGDLLHRTGAEPSAAEQAHQTALALALNQGARFYALRAATGLSTLLAQVGRCAEAADLLQETLSWFPAAPSRSADIEAARSLLLKLL